MKLQIGFIFLSFYIIYESKLCCDQNFKIPFFFVSGTVEPDKIKFNTRDLNLKQDVIFYLYTAETRDDPGRLQFANKRSLSASKYNKNLPTKFIVHGWLADYQSPSAALIKDAFLDHGKYNVIVMDWSVIAKKDYFEAASRVQSIGRHLGNMITFLRREGSKPKTMQIVGHCLGAHISGIAGSHSKKNINHIVALDPAAPGFRDHDENGRISKLAAETVEVIHTDTEEFGLPDALGKSDIYPNGGKNQPGCIEKNCSHNRAVEYYAEAINNPDNWKAVYCQNFDKFQKGECQNNIPVSFPGADPRNSEGKFYLYTKCESPYGKGKDGARAENSPTCLSNKSVDQQAI